MNKNFKDASEAVIAAKLPSGIESIRRSFTLRGKRERQRRKRFFISWARTSGRLWPTPSDTCTILSLKVRFKLVPIKRAGHSSKITSLFCL